MSRFLLGLILITLCVFYIALTVSSGILDGSVDLLLGVQYSWSEPEEKEDQLRGLADCVSRRLDQGIINQYAIVVIYIAKEVAK